MAKKTIAVLATLDTKGPEAEFLRQQIGKHGLKAMVIDVGAFASERDALREAGLAEGAALELFETRGGQ